MQAKNDYVSIFIRSFGEKLRAIRASKDLTVLKMAMLTDIQPSVISKIENEQNTLFETYHKITTSLSIDISDILPIIPYPIEPLPPPPSSQYLSDVSKLVHDLSELQRILPDCVGVMDAFRTRHFACGESSFPDERRSPIRVALGERFRMIKNARGYKTYPSLETATNIKRGTLQMIERGFRNPGMDALIQISASMRVHPSILLPTEPHHPADLRPYIIASNLSLVMDKQESLESMQRDISDVTILLAQ